jgi:hypothetical protein
MNHLRCTTESGKVLLSERKKKTFQGVEKRGGGITLKNLVSGAEVKFKFVCGEEFALKMELPKRNTESACVLRFPYQYINKCVST